MFRNDKGGLYRSISFADRDIVVEVPSRSQLNFGNILRLNSIHFKSTIFFIN